MTGAKGASALSKEALDMRRLSGIFLVHGSNSRSATGLCCEGYSEWEHNIGLCQNAPLMWSVWVVDTWT